MASVRNGQIVDELEIFTDIVEALKAITSALEQVEARVRILENGR